MATVKPGQSCHRVTVGTNLFGPCPDCDHLALLHTDPDGRGCAGCEAITEAQRTARAVIQDAVDRLGRAKP